MQAGFKVLSWLVISCCFICNAFAQKQDYAVAVLDNEEIYFSEIKQASENLNRFLKDNFETSYDWRLNFIKNYVIIYALSKKAAAEELDKDKDVMFRVLDFKRKALAEKLLKNNIEKKEINEDDLNDYYEKDKAKYQIKEKIKITYLIIKNKKEADKIAEDLNGGKSFGQIWGKKKVAIKNFLPRDSAHVSESKADEFTVPDEVFSLGVGGSSVPFEIKDKFYIFHIDAKESAQDVPYDQVRGRVIDEYNKELRDTIMTSIVEEVFKNQNVKIYDDAIKSEFDIEKEEITKQTEKTE